MYKISKKKGKNIRKINFKFVFKMFWCTFNFLLRLNKKHHNLWEI